MTDETTNEGQETVPEPAPEAVEDHEAAVAGELADNTADADVAAEEIAHVAAKDAKVAEKKAASVATATADDDAAAIDKKEGGKRRRRGRAKTKGGEPKAPKLDLVRLFEEKMLRNDIPVFRPGDTLKVSVKIREGEKERIQAYEGVCISRKHGGVRETFTVRKISAANVGVERTFYLHSKRLEKIELVRRGVVRRAKIYYLRELRGKAARIRERRD